MANFNIRMRKFNGSDWDILYPMTIASNVTANSGKTVEQELNTMFDKVATSSSNGAMSAADKKKLDGIEANANNYVHPNNASTRHVTDSQISSWNDKYTKLEIDNKFNELNVGLDWKESVATFDDIATTYPNPQDGWTVNTKDTDITYRYTGTTWIAISANAIPLASQTTDGKMSKTDKRTLDNLAVKVADLEEDMGSFSEGVAGDLSGIISRISTAEKSIQTVDGKVASLQTEKSDVNHNHDSTYSKTTHNHDSVYSKTTHNHDNSYLNLSGGKMQGAINMASNAIKITDSSVGNAAIGHENSSGDIYISNINNDYLRLKSNKTMTYAGYKIYTALEKPTASEVGALPITGGTLTGNLIIGTNHLKGTNGTTMIKDFGNGNVTLSAGVNSDGTAGSLYLGYNSGSDHKTKDVRLESTMTWKGSHTIVDSNGYIPWSAISDVPDMGNDTIDGDLTVNGEIFINGTNKVYHPGNKPTPADIGAATSSHTHNYAGSSSAGGAATSALACTGNSATATTLQTARTINGTSFNGSANITTANWGTARTITIGNSGKSVNGSGNVTWTLAEIGAAAESHTHSYLPLSGGTLTGHIAYTLYNSTQTPLKIYGGDANGQGISIGAGGSTIISSGEGRDQISPNIAATTETMAIGSDQTIEFYTALQNGWASRKTMSMGTDGRLTNSNGFVGPLSGNATTATTLQTARTINGTSFNGSANITTANWGTARTITIGSTGKSVNGSANVTWSLSEIGAAAASHTHSNYVPTSDYGLTTISKTLTITTSWQDTGITGTNLTSGSYMVQVSGMTSDATSTWQEIWTGTMSWFNGTTNSTDSDEIILHKAGHASNGRTIYLRTIRSSSSGYLKLQICATTAFTSSNVTFKFRKLI